MDLKKGQQPGMKFPWERRQRPVRRGRGRLCWDKGGLLQEEALWSSEEVASSGQQARLLAPFAGSSGVSPSQSHFLGRTPCSQGRGLHGAFPLPVRRGEVAREWGNARPSGCFGDSCFPSSKRSEASVPKFERRASRSQESQQDVRLQRVTQGSLEEEPFLTGPSGFSLKALTYERDPSILRWSSPPLISLLRC